MMETTQLNKEFFLSIAKAFGLDIHDPHIEELYTYVQKILPVMKRFEELDLTGMEPVMFPPALAAVSQYEKSRHFERAKRRSGEKDLER